MILTSVAEPELIFLVGQSRERCKAAPAGYFRKAKRKILVLVLAVNKDKCDPKMIFFINN